MSPGVKVAGFALVLLMIFGAGLVVGSAVGPLGVGDDEPPRVDEPHDMDGRGTAS